MAALPLGVGDRKRAADGFLGSYSALAQAANRAAKGTAAATAQAAASTLHATEYASAAVASKTKTYTGRFQSTVKQSLAKGDDSKATLAAESAELPPPPARATPKPRTAAEREQDVRADHVIFDTATPEGRAALRREAVAAINANSRLREKLRVSDGTRADELERLLRLYHSHIARYEGNILSTVQAGAEGQERLDLAGQVRGAESTCVRVGVRAHTRAQRVHARSLGTRGGTRVVGAPTVC